MNPIAMPETLFASATLNRTASASRRPPMNPVAMPETFVATTAPAKATVTADSGHDAIRPFRVDIPEEALVDLRNRLAATRLPDRETVSDNSQGVPLATVRKLVRYWANEYDWR